MTIAERLTISLVVLVGAGCQELLSLGEFTDRDPLVGGSGAGGSTVATSPNGGGPGLGGDGGTGGGGGEPPLFGAPVSVATDQVALREIAADDEGVFWLCEGAAADQGSLVSLAEGTLHQALQEPRGLALSSTSAFFTARGVDYYTAFKSPRVMPQGQLQQAEGDYPDWEGTTAVAVDGLNLITGGAGNFGRIVRGDTDLTHSKEFVSGDVPFAVAGDGSEIWWASATFKGIGRLSVPNTHYSMLMFPPNDLLVDDTHVYFSADDGSVRRLSKAAPETPAEVLASEEAQPRGLSSDGQRVIWANASSGEIRAFIISTQTVETIGVVEEPFDTAVNGDGVYVSDRGASAVVLFPKVP